MIRTKIIIIVIGSITLLTGLLYFISSNLLLESYQRIEDTQMTRNLVRIQGAFSNYSNALNIKLKDWSNWDDTYQFVQDGNSEYLESNLAIESLINLEINYMGFVDVNKNIVFAALVDLNEESEVPSVALTQELLNFERLFAEEGSSGIIQLADGLMMIEALPILKSDGTGPMAGTLIFGRSVDAPLIESFEELTQLSITLFSSDEAALPPSTADAKRQLQSAQYVIQPESEEIIAGYFLLEDVEGRPISLVEAESSREVYQHGKSTITIFVIISSLSIMLFGIIMLILFETLLIGRFSRLSKEVMGISVENLAHAHVYEGKNDEIGKLAEKINNLLAELFRAQEKEAQARKLEKSAQKNLAQNLQTTEEMNKLMIGREIKMVELKDKIKKLEEEIKSHQQ